MLGENDLYSIIRSLTVSIPGSAFSSEREVSDV
jgi:hypothetical protein